MFRIIFDVIFRDGPVLSAPSEQTLIEPHPWFLDTGLLPVLVGHLPGKRLHFRATVVAIAAK